MNEYQESKNFQTIDQKGLAFLGHPAAVKIPLLEIHFSADNFNEFENSWAVYIARDRFIFAVDHQQHLFPGAKVTSS